MRGASPLRQTVEDPPRLLFNRSSCLIGSFAEYFFGSFEKLRLVPVRPVFTGPNGASVGGQLEDGDGARQVRGFVLVLGRSFTHVCWRQLDADCLAGPLRFDLFPLLASIVAEEEIARAIKRKKPLAVRYSRRNREARRYRADPARAGRFCNDPAIHVRRFSLGRYGGTLRFHRDRF